MVLFMTRRSGDRKQGKQAAGRGGKGARGMLAALAAFAALSAGVSAQAAGAADAEPAPSSGTPTLIVDPAPDAARLDLVRHELTLRLDGGGATLDGKGIKTAKPILRDGRVYVALRTLGQSGALSTVAWDPQRKAIHVEPNPDISLGLFGMTFRIGSDQVYDAGGTQPLSLSTPKPFLAGGVAYVPVKAMSWLGMSATSANGKVTLNWSEKPVQVLTPSWETSEEQTTFTMLYRKELYAPQVLASLGTGAWGGGTDGSQIVEKDIAIGGQLYNRIQFTVRLHPGINVLQAAPLGMNGAEFKVVRRIDDPSAEPVRYTEFGKEFLTVTAPASGFVETTAGTPIAVSGQVAVPEGQNFDKVTVIIQKYMPEGAGFAHQVYETVGSQDIEIKDGAFAGIITLKEAGSYWIAIDSPAYIPYPETGLGATKWAEFFAEVR